MKKVLILGVGPETSAIADLLDRDEDVKEIICADDNMLNALKLSSRLTKARPVQIDTRDYSDILEAGRGAGAIVTGDPCRCNPAAATVAIEIDALLV